MTFITQASNGKVIRSIGRPNDYSSLDYSVIQQVNDAQLGTEFLSTDGAGVGAIRWLKTADGWELINGDTGWLTLQEAPLFVVKVRRHLNQVHLSIDNWSGVRFQLPVGFGGSDWDGTNYNDEIWLQFPVVSDQLSIKRPNSLSNPDANAFFHYPIESRQDLQRAIGNVELTPDNYFSLKGTDPNLPNGDANDVTHWLTRDSTDTQKNTGQHGISFYTSFLTHSDYPATLPSSL